jgi:1-deoxy-D-xylulose-5-phosphate reductoisomerase
MQSRAVQCPAILNAANEVAVAAFLDRRVGFTAIAAIVERVMERYEAAPPASIEEVLAVDSEARRISAALIESEFA